MKTIAHGLQELAERADALGFHHKVEPGSVYWVPNQVLQFGDSTNGGRHPVLVVDVMDNLAEVCILTSKVERNRTNGICHEPMAEAGLRKPGVIITKEFGRRWLELRWLNRDSYLGRVSPQYESLLSKFQVY